MNKKFLILIILNLFLASAALAQFPAEFVVNSMPNPIPNGPTINPQTAELLIESPPTVFTSANPQIFVTASLSNQQYTGLNTVSPGAPPGNPVVMFGATDNPNFGQAFARPRPVFAPMTEIGSATDAMFSNVQNGNNTGIEVARNYAFNMFTSIQHFAGITPGNLTTDGKVVPPTSARVHFANLTLTFSQPVNNPYIHLVALGGRSSGGNGFASEFDLVTAGITLEKVSGTASLVVSPTSITNGSNDIDVSCLNNSAACGTVRLRGTNITTVTFQIWVDGDGMDPTVWADPNFHTGDQWMIGASIPTSFIPTTAASAEINGRINNPAGLRLKDVTLTATALSTGERFYTVADSAGNYRFAGLPVSESYLVQAKSRYFRFEPDSKIVTLNGDLADIDFTAVSSGKPRGDR